MQASTAENLVSLFCSVSRLTSKRFSTSAAKKKLSFTIKEKAASRKISPSSSSLQDAALKKYVSSIKSSSVVSKSAQYLAKNYKAPPSSKILSPPNSSLHGIVIDRLNDGCKEGDDESAKQLSTHASNLLHCNMYLDWEDEYTEGTGEILDKSWLTRMSNNTISLFKTELTRERKQKWVYEGKQCTRFSKLIKMCAKIIGTDATLTLFGSLGKESGMKEYSAMIKVCIDKARETTDENVSLEQVYNAYQIFKLIKESGSKIEEETYGEFLSYLIDFGMVEEFFFFHELIKDQNTESLPRLAYYEMLLWIKVNSEEKIQDLCNAVVADDSEENYCRRESLLLALCESGRKQEVLVLVKTLDVTKITSLASLNSLFHYLGKLLLEPFVEKFLLELKRIDVGAENLSNFICGYAISIPNLAVEDIIVKFQTLHTKLEVLPTKTGYEKLIRVCCGFLKVHEALNVIDEALKSGIALSVETFHLLLDACDQSCEFNLVHQINLKIKCHNFNVKPNVETFRKMILLCVKMKDFEGAYGLIDDLQNLELKPTSCIYNIILAAYFREKNSLSAMNVLKQMEDAGVKPDAMTYSYLIGNSRCEKDITKYYDDMRSSQVQPTKHIFMALINAYASCGLIENAKQVISNKKIPGNNLNEVKSVLIGALASNGHISDAFKTYAEIKESNSIAEPKAIRYLIDHFHPEGELNDLLHLLEELKGSHYWIDACFRVISRCVRDENLRVTVDLLKQVMEKFIDDEFALEVLFDEVFSLLAENEPLDMQFGLKLLHAIKEELDIQPSRKSLDFLLCACVTAQDARASCAIWKEYEKAELPYNVLSYVRMYQALLASGEQKSAETILSKISKHDPHVRIVIEACDKTFKKKPAPVLTKGKKKKKALRAVLGLSNAIDSKSR